MGARWRRSNIVLASVSLAAVLEQLGHLFSKHTFSLVLVFVMNVGAAIASFSFSLSCSVDTYCQFFEEFIAFHVFDQLQTALSDCSLKV